MPSFARHAKNPLLLLIFLIVFFPVVNAQSQDNQTKAAIDRAISDNANRVNQRPDLNIVRRDAILNDEVRPSSLMPAISSVQPGAQKATTATCVDSSFLKVFESSNRAYSFLCSYKTKDGGVVLGGFGRNQLEGPPYNWHAVVSKFDSTGNHIWSKEVRSNAEPSFTIEGISELSDGSLVITGWHDNPLSATLPTPYVDFFVAKLNSTGDLLWLKTFHSLLGNDCTTSNIRYASVSEGANGDLFLGATVTNCPYPQYLVVMKLSNQGDLVWKYSFADPGSDAYCFGIFYEGSYITVVNRGSVGNSILVSLIRLDEVTGAYISHKSWKPDLPYPAEFYAGFISWTPKAIRLSNGNYCVYGQTLGDYNFTVADMPHFAVLEFDKTFNYVKGYTINSTLVTNVYDNKIIVDRFGRVVYVMTTFTHHLTKTKHIGSADNGSIVHQRKKTLPNLEVFYDNFELFDNGSFVYINNIASPGQDNFYLYYSLLHNTDTSSDCLGLTDDFSYIVPIRYIAEDFNWSVINPDFLITTNNNGNSVLPLIYTASTPCFEKSFCDTLKIHGNVSSCDVQHAFAFTAFKNQECGSAVTWRMDNSAVRLFRPVNDTTLQIEFNTAWQGWLYAEINTSCGIVTDSMLLTVFESPGAVNLGPDTSVCKNNSILLNAHSGYKNYLWSNGSVDSTITVNTAGKYYVDVADACGNFFSDTIIVSEASAIPFDIGPDRTICANDTLHLVAPDGFLNYRWGPAYNLSGVSGRAVVVQPAIDTLYFVEAEKTLGCFVGDTVRIKVNHSPTIDLGPDASFCSGDSLILDAGSSFASFEWSNGTTTQQTTVHQAGDISVMATTAEGCISYDMLKVVNVWPNPVVTLDKDAGLCENTTRVLHAGNFSSYLWQNGSTAPAIVAESTGTYFVTVWDNNLCSGSDTVHISRILPLPSRFLPPDTVICNYGSILIKPSGNYQQYTWSNHSTLPAISITSPGTYWLEVTDSYNCIGKDSITVAPKECLSGFYIPTAFTPDNNGINDFFKPIIGGHLKQYSFTVYNRWGQVVFATKDIYRGWDGRFAGQVQDSHAFAWICTYQLEGAEMRTEKGTVVLIR